MQEPAEEAGIATGKIGCLATALCLDRALRMRVRNLRAYLSRDTPS